MSTDPTQPDDAENSGDLAANMQRGSSGGSIATDVGSRDEMKRETEGDAGITRVTKQDKIQPETGTRSDNEGANSR